MRGYLILQARRLLLPVAFLVWTVCGSQAAFACGFHDPSEMIRGMMNWTYPDSLHVGTAVREAQMAGQLEQDEPASRDDPGPEARSRYGYLRASRWLHQLQARLAAAPERGPRPAMAVVLLGSLLWSRYHADGAEVALAVHAEGPADGDLVVVTEATVIKALAEHRIGIDEAMQLGVIRFYGEPAAVQAAVEWLRLATPDQS